MQLLTQIPVQQWLVTCAVDGSYSIQGTAAGGKGCTNQPIWPLHTQYYTCNSIEVSMIYLCDFEAANGRHSV